MEVRESPFCLMTSEEKECDVANTACKRYELSLVIHATIMVALVGLTGARETEARAVHHRIEEMRMIISIPPSEVHCEHAWNRYLYVFL
jgi:hypothetical protein